jgi:alkyl hydroperoxide reductase subunit AhpF
MVLSREAKKETEEKLSGLKRPVSLSVLTQDIEASNCKETRAIAEGLAEMSPKVMVECADFLANGSIVRKYAVERIPALVVSSKEGGMAHFYGTPTGYLFFSLIEALRGAANGPVLSEETRAWLDGLDRDLHIQLFVSPTCPHCPPMVNLAHRLSLCSGRVFAAAVNVCEFPFLAIKHKVESIPFAVVNGIAVSNEALSEKAFVDKLKYLEK